MKTFLQILFAFLVLSNLGAIKDQLKDIHAELAVIAAVHAGSR